MARPTAPPLARVFRVHVVADPGVRVDDVRGGASFRLDHHEISRCTRLPCDVLIGGAAGWGDAAGVASHPWLQLGGDDGTSELRLRRDDVDGTTVRVHRMPLLRAVVPMALTGVGLAALGAGLWVYGRVGPPNGCATGPCDAWRDGGYVALGTALALVTATFVVYSVADSRRISIDRPAPPRIGFAPMLLPAGLGAGLVLRM